jgi:hypothetical protein
MNDKRILLALILFVGGYFAFRSFHDARRSHASTRAASTPGQLSQNTSGDAMPLLIASAVETPLIHASFRPLTFALLRGGFNSVNEFYERVHDDPVLRDFYGDCADRNASLRALPEDITAFTTFRRGDSIKWAQRPLLVKKGEYVMTFCGKAVLARCGNLISFAPMQPSEDVPPTILEAPSEPAEAPLTLVADGGPAAADMGPASPFAHPAVVPAAAHSHGFFFIPPFYIPPSSGSHSSPGGTVIVPPPVGHLSGDEFSGHQRLFTLLIGLFVIALLKLTTR